MTVISLGFITNLLQPSHLIAILVLALLLFHRRVPSIARGIGSSFAGFREALQGEKDRTIEASDPSKTLHEKSRDRV